MVTYRVECGAVLGGFDNLNGGLVTGLDVGTDGEGHLGEADGARVGVVGRAEDLKGLDHGVAHVGGTAVDVDALVGAEAKVDLHKGREMAAEPTRLEGNGAAADGPVGTVLGDAHAAACVMVSEMKLDEDGRSARPNVERSESHKPESSEASNDHKATSSEARKERKKTYKGTSIACRRETSRW